MHYSNLVQTLDSKDSMFLAELHSREVIDSGEKEDLESIESCTRRNEKLLSILGRKSAPQFDQFVEALRESGQEGLGRILNESHCSTNNDGSEWSSLF